MNRLRKLIAVAVLFLMTAKGYSFTALYVFGDSLSDTGRSPASPPANYFNGRFCNGPLWIEYLSTNLNLPYNASNNFAVSGSTTSNLQSQIAGLPASTNLHSGLFTVWSAGNDFLDNATLGVNDPAWNIVITNAVFNLTNALGTLYTNGAREIIIGNLPALGRIPAFNGTPLGYTNYVDSKVTTFNTMLAGAVTNVMQRSPGLRIYLMDNFTLLNNILNAPASFGFTVTTNGALEDPNLTNKSFNGPGANYVFWDVIHPTTKANVLTAAAAQLEVGVGLGLANSSGNLHLTVSNLYPGFQYAIQGSTNFIVWTNFQSFIATTTNTTMAVTNAGRAIFYRIGY